MTRKQFARKHSDGNDSDGKQSDIEENALTPSERKALLALLPLKTHVDMVTLTLDNLEMKLGALDAFGETQDEMSAENVELLRRLSERLMMQRERIDIALKSHSSLR